MCRPAPDRRTIFNYRLHSPDGDDLGEATYPGRVKIGEELFFGGSRRFRVLDVMIYDEEDESPFVGLPEGRGGLA
jgi:hypothetical protein